MILIEKELKQAELFQKFCHGGTPAFLFTGVLVTFLCGYLDNLGCKSRPKGKFLLAQGVSEFNQTSKYFPECSSCENLLMGHNFLNEKAVDRITLLNFRSSQ